MSSQVYFDRPCMVSALGNSLAEAVQRLPDGPPSPVYREQPATGECAGYFLPADTVAGLSLMDRLDGLIRHCHQQAQSLSDCLLVLASTTQSIELIENRVREEGNFNDSHVYRLDWMAESLREQWGFGEALSINTSCTSAANAIIYGARLVREGQYRQVMVLAYETPSELVLQGFGGLGLNSPSGNYRPFHPERDGLVLGEAYAGVLLGKDRTPDTCGEFLGGASGCDTSSMTATREDGSHIHAMVERALGEAAVSPEDIQLLKYHGTGTDSNDRAEAAATTRIFQGKSPAACCLKPWLGHTLGACGLTELLLILYCLSNNQSLPALPYAAEAIMQMPSTLDGLSAAAPVMANFSGFGGNNASLIVRGIAS